MARLPTDDLDSDGSSTDSDTSDSDTTDQEELIQQRKDTDTTQPSPETTNTDSTSSNTNPLAEGPLGDINEGRRDTGSSESDSNTDTDTDTSKDTPTPPGDVNEGRRGTTNSSGTNGETTNNTGELPSRGPRQETTGRQRTTTETSDTSDTTSTVGSTESFVSTQGLETEDSRRGQAAQEAEQETIDSSPFLDDPDEVRVDPESGQVELTTEGREAQREFRRSQITSEVAGNNPGLTASEVSVDLDAAGGPDVDLTDEGEAQAAGLVGAPQQGGLRDIQEGSVEQRFADEAGNAVTTDEVDATFTGGTVDVDVEPTGGVTEIAPSQGGLRSVQQESLENAIAERAGNAVSPEEVNVDLTGTDPKIDIAEETPVVAQQQGGRRQLQESSIQSGVASSVAGVTSAGVNANLTASGSDAELNEAGRVQAARERVLERNPELSGDDIRVESTDEGIQASVTDSYRREQLREQAEAEFPNAEEIDIVEQNGELVAEVSQENGIDTAIRYGQNLVSDPVGSITEGTGDIYSDLAGDTEDFIEGRAEGIRNPEGTFDWAVSGVEENTIDPTVSAVETVASDPVGIAQGSVEDIAGGVVSLAEGGANASAGLVEGGINAVQNFNLQEDTPGGTAGAALLGGTVVSPIPGDEVAVGAALAGVAAGSALVAGGNAAYQEATRNRETTFTPPGVSNELEVGEGGESGEIAAPTSPRTFGESEISVNEETGLVQQEVELPENVSGDDVEVTVPENVDDSAVTTRDGEISIPAEFTPVIVSGELRSEEQEEEEDEEKDEEEEEEEEEVSEGEIIVELPEDSQYNPEDILEESERPDVVEEEFADERADSETGGERSLGDRFRDLLERGPRPGAFGERTGESAVPSSGVVGSEFADEALTRTQERERVEDAQNPEATVPDLSLMGSPSDAGAFPLSSVDDQEASPADSVGAIPLDVPAVGDLDEAASTSGSADLAAEAEATGTLEATAPALDLQLGQVADIVEQNAQRPGEATGEQLQNQFENPNRTRVRNSAPRPPSSNNSRRPFELPEFDGGDSDEEEFDFVGVSDASFTDFVDPLSGEVIETSRDE